MPLPSRKLLLQRPGPIVTSPEEYEILEEQQWFSDLIVPRLLSGRRESQRKLLKEFLRRRIYSFVNQCFGLLCFVDCTGIGPFVIWNPNTNEERYLPPPGDDVLRAPTEVCRSLGFASCFGYDAESDDYKVLVHVRHFPYILDKDGYFEADDGPTVERYLLYSLRNDRWTDFPRPCSYPNHTLMPDSVYLNGCCFWMSWGRECVVSFSFSDESFSSFPLVIPTIESLDCLVIPPTIESWDCQDDAVEFVNCHYNITMVDAVEEDTLAFVVYRLSHFQLWTCLINDGRRPTVGDDGRTFVMRWEIFVDFPEECGRMSSNEIGRPLALHQEGDELLMFMSNSNDQLMVYDLAAKELKLLPIFSYPGALRLISYHDTAKSLADY